jgi:hypothetical protein
MSHSSQLARLEIESKSCYNKKKTTNTWKRGWLMFDFFFSFFPVLKCYILTIIWPKPHSMAMVCIYAQSTVQLYLPPHPAAKWARQFPPCQKHPKAKQIKVTRCMSCVSSLSPWNPHYRCTCPTLWNFHRPPLGSIYIPPPTKPLPIGLKTYR